MEEISNLEKLECIRSFQSTISKLENALSQMTNSGANTTLIKKRLNSVRIGLATLEHVWNQSPLNYTQEELVEARNVIAGLFRSIENSYAKSKTGSPQRTLLERRIKALQQSSQAIHEILTK
ncbi:hypothetical protein D3C78_839370 [compost metagenome]